MSPHPRGRQVLVILGYEAGASNVVTKEIKRIEVMELLVNGKMPNQEAAESLRAYEGSFGSGRTKGTIRPMSCFHPSKEVSEAKTTPLRSSPFSRVSIPLRKFRKTGL